jgi:DNA-binding GntR family transcriptional regulator
MPVRDALSRLAAEGAVVIRSKRKIEAPPMSEARFTDLLACRLLLEPEAAVLALPHRPARGACARSTPPSTPPCRAAT